jgi:GNAT superfamily N-acetyltransferase
MCEPVKGYEDIHSDTPYIEAWTSGEVGYIDMLYVPPSLRGEGHGTKLVNDWIGSLDASIKRVKLTACTLGGMDGFAFWSGMGFELAYTGHVYHEVERIMVRGVNGYSMPVQEFIHSDDEGLRDLYEGADELKHFQLHPQTHNTF